MLTHVDHYLRLIQSFIESLEKKSEPDSLANEFVNYFAANDSSETFPVGNSLLKNLCIFEVVAISEYRSVLKLLLVLCERLPKVCYKYRSFLLSYAIRGISVSFFNGSHDSEYCRLFHGVHFGILKETVGVDKYGAMWGNLLKDLLLLRNALIVQLFGNQSQLEIELNETSLLSNDCLDKCEPSLKVNVIHGIDNCIKMELCCTGPQLKTFHIQSAFSILKNSLSALFLSKSFYFSKSCLAIFERTVEILAFILIRLKTLCLRSSNTIASLFEDIYPSIWKNSCNSKRKFLCLQLFKSITASVGRYCLKPELVEQLMGDIKTDIVGLCTPLQNNMSSTPQYKSNRKRKRSSIEVEYIENTGQSIETKSAAVWAQSDLKLLEELLDSLRFILNEYTDLLGAKCIHSVMAQIMYLGFSVYGPQEKFSLSMDHIKILKSGLLELLLAFVSNVHPKCSSPLSMIAYISQQALLENDEKIRCLAEKLMAFCESSAKPSAVPAFSSVSLPYEPEKEINEVGIQTTFQEVQYKSSYSQTYEVLHATKNSRNEAYGINEYPSKMKVSKKITPKNEYREDFSNSRDEHDLLTGLMSEIDKDFLELCSDFKLD